MKRTKEVIPALISAVMAFCYVTAPLADDSINVFYDNAELGTESASFYSDDLEDEQNEFFWEHSVENSGTITPDEAREDVSYFSDDASYDTGFFYEDGNSYYTEEENASENYSEDTNLSNDIVLSESTVMPAESEDEPSLSLNIAAVKTSGTCGPDVSWNWSNGTLTISGTGPMTNYAVDEKPPYADFFLEDVQTKEIVIEYGVTSIGSFAFRNNLAEKVEIPKSVTKIGESAFEDSISLTNVEIPKSVKAIGDYAFYGCSDLTSVILEHGIKIIGTGAFEMCQALPEITIPASVEEVKSRSFADCIELRKLHFKGKPPKFGKRVFALTPSDAEELVDSEEIDTDKSTDEQYKNVESIKAYIPMEESAWSGSAFPEGARVIQWIKYDVNNTSDPEPCFEESRDAWGFKNSKEDFDLIDPKNYYYILGEDYSRLISKLRNTDIERVTFTDWDEKKRNIIYRLIDESNGDVFAPFILKLNKWRPALYSIKRWNGSCYGLSALAALIAGGNSILREEILTGGNPSDVIRPNENQISAINFYYGLQKLGTIMTQSAQLADSKCSDKIDIIEQTALIADREKRPFLVCFSGHAVVGFGIESGIWEYDIDGGKETFNRRILIYDCAREDSNELDLNHSSDIYYRVNNGDNDLYYIPAHGVLESKDGQKKKILELIISDHNELNTVDYISGDISDTVYSGQVIYDYVLDTRISDSYYLEIDYDNKKCKINGEKYCYNDEKVWREAITSYDVDAADNNYETASIVLPLSEYYSISSKSSMSNRICSNNNMMSISTTSGGDISYKTDSKTVISTNSPSNNKIRITANDVHNTFLYPTVEVNSRNNSFLSAELISDGVKIEGDYLGDVIVFATDYNSEQWQSISTDYKSILVTMEPTTNNIVTYADSDMDGTYETMICDQSSENPPEEYGSGTGEEEYRFNAPVIKSLENRSSSVKVTWEPVDGVATYRIYRKVKDGQWEKLNDTLGSEYRDEKVKSGTKYSYTVCCVSDDGSEELSPYDENGKDIIFLLTPSGFTLKKKSSTSFNVSWKRVSSASSYQLQYSTDKKFATKKTVKIGKNTTTSSKIKGLKKHRTWYVRIRSCKKSGSITSYSKWSSVKKIKL